MSALYAVFGVLIIGGFGLCLVLGIMGMVSIIAGSSQKYVVYNGNLYKLREPGCDEHGDEVFLYIVDNKLQNVFDIRR